MRTNPRKTSQQLLLCDTFPRESKRKNTAPPYTGVFLWLQLPRLCTDVAPFPMSLYTGSSCHRFARRSSDNFFQFGGNDHIHMYMPSRSCRVTLDFRKLLLEYYREQFESEWDMQCSFPLRTRGRHNVGRQQAQNTDSGILVVGKTDVGALSTISSRVMKHSRL